MLRSLPSRSRIVWGIVIAIVLIICFYEQGLPLLRSSRQPPCDDDICPILPHEEVLNPPTRQEFVALELQLKRLSEELDRLKNIEPPKKELTPEEQEWESRRTQCVKSVERNIDYIHVLPYTYKAYRRVSTMRNSGQVHPANSGSQSPANGDHT